MIFRFSCPACLSSAFALSASGPPLYGLTPLYQGLGGETASVAVTAVPNQSRLWNSFRSTAQAIAWRTRRSLNGGRLQLRTMKYGRYGLPGEEANSLEPSSSS